VISKADILAGAVAAGSALVAQAATGAGELAQIPGLSEVANLSAVGAMIYLVLRTIPKLTQDFRDEMKEEREFHRDQVDKLREHFRCERGDK
jgi:hypothetical protein